MSLHVIYLCALAVMGLEEAFRSSNDCSNINDSVNHSAHRTSKEPSFLVECTQLIGAPQKYICANAGTVSERNTFHHSFPSCLTQLPITQWLDAMWELWGGLPLVVVGSLCGFQLCVCALLNHGSLIT